MTPDDLDRLEALAAAATPGEWRRLDTGSEGCSVVSATARPARVARLTSGSLERCQADAGYIAALDPATVQQLIAAARLGAAWQAAEAALPKSRGRWGYSIAGLDYRLAGWRAYANGALTGEHVEDFGPTPAAALLSLAEALRGRK